MIRELKKEIKRLIDPIRELAFEVMPDKKKFPHVVADLGQVMHQEGLYQLMLDVDVWDFSTHTVAVDTISEAIADVLNRYQYRSETMTFTVWHTATLNVGSDDPALRRKTVQFEIQARRSAV